MNRNIFLDGIFGVVTGDALGDSVQFMSREEVIRRGLVTGMEDGGPSLHLIKILFYLKALQICLLFISKFVAFYSFLNCLVMSPFI